MWTDSGYAYAKASWIVGKSFLGKRVSSLSGIHTLSELDRLVFPDYYRELPGRTLLADLEERIAERAIRHILSVVNSFSQPPKLLVRMLKNDDDSNFYQGLIESLSQLDSDDREIAARLLADEISLRNSILALRLRAYYNKSEAEIKKHLMELKLHGNINQKKSSLASEAKASLEFSLDVRQDWRGWKWERFLNQEDGSAHWTLDPRHFQNAALQHLAHLCYHNFHTLPMSVSAIYCFIKLKQFEEDLLTSVAEGLALGMDSSYVFRLLEVT